MMPQIKNNTFRKHYRLKLRFKMNNNDILKKFKKTQNSHKTPKCQLKNNENYTQRVFKCKLSENTKQLELKNIQNNIFKIFTNSKMSKKPTNQNFKNYEK